MLGTWIDGLTDEERDRIVRAQKWRHRAFLWEDGARCLLGHVKDASVPNRETVVLVESGWCDLLSFSVSVEATGKDDYAAMHTFDALVDRFGLERVVRAVKKRAGASIEDLSAEPAETATAT